MAFIANYSGSHKTLNVWCTRLSTKTVELAAHRSKKNKKDTDHMTFITKDKLIRFLDLKLLAYRAYYYVL